MNLGTLMLCASGLVPSLLWVLNLVPAINTIRILIYIMLPIVCTYAYTNLLHLLARRRSDHGVVGEPPGT